MDKNPLIAWQAAADRLRVPENRRQEILQLRESLPRHVRVGFAGFMGTGKSCSVSNVARAFGALVGHEARASSSASVTHRTQEYTLEINGTVILTIRDPAGFEHIFPSDKVSGIARYLCGTSFAKHNVVPWSRTLWEFLSEQVYTYQAHPVDAMVFVGTVHDSLDASLKLLCTLVSEYRRTATHPDLTFILLTHAGIPPRGFCAEDVERKRRIASETGCSNIYIVNNVTVDDAVLHAPEEQQQPQNTYIDLIKHILLVAHARELPRAAGPDWVIDRRLIASCIILVLLAVLVGCILAVMR